jgi:MFS family permease
VFHPCGLCCAYSLSLHLVNERGTFFQQHGYYPDEGLFMGVTGQSQTLGPLVAVVATFLLADWLFNVKKWSWLYALLFACTPILIYKTGSRTAMGTYLAGLLFVFFFFMRARGLGARWKERVLALGFFVGLVAILSLFATPSMRASVRDFAFKWDKGEEVTDKTTWDKLTSTRQGKVDEMRENIADSPAIGNGFQVSKEMQYLEVRDFSQLLSRPVEKGVWIYAVMEEGGYFGMTLFLLFLLVVFTSLLSRRAYVTVVVFAVFIVSNFGEFSIFSMSGIAGIFWALVFVAAVFDAQTIRQRQRLMLAPAAR